MQDVITLNTSVKPILYRKALFKGCFCGFLGALILILLSFFTPLDKLETVGPFGGLLSLLLIGFGFQPFLRLKKLEMKPIPLKLTDQGLFWKNIKIVTGNIKSTRYIDENNQYGIEITSKEGQILFLPYYSKRSYEEFISFLDDGFHAE